MGNAFTLTCVLDEITRRVAIRERGRRTVANRRAPEIGQFEVELQLIHTIAQLFPGDRGRYPVTDPPVVAQQAERTRVRCDPRNPVNCVTLQRQQVCHKPGPNPQHTGNIVWLYEPPHTSEHPGHG